ncbi:MAG: CRISPR-associated endoribonuclease Cas6 [Bacteroidota bacterium]|nr:CRISPR-associated endoribonuclease Cas6 [Bacteroidota bacterium]
MDYQYYLSAWIYKVISKGDSEFAEFLHSEGYTTGYKRFKLFNYSPLDFGKPKLWEEKALFEIQVEQIVLKVSFHLVEAAEKFIIGLFNNQQVYVGDQFNGLDLVVKQVERLAEPVLTTTMKYKAVSPVVISLKHEDSKYARYMAPVDNNYSDLLRQHLWNKFQSIPNGFNMPEDSNFRFEPKSEARSKLVTIKSYTPEQSKIRGFTFDFTLTCPVEIHQLVLASGIGEKNSMGFGWCEVIK